MDHRLDLIDAGQVIAASGVVDGPDGSERAFRRGGGHGRGPDDSPAAALDHHPAGSERSAVAATGSTDSVEKPGRDSAANSTRWRAPIRGSEASPTGPADGSTRTGAGGGMGSGSGSAEAPRRRSAAVLDRPKVGDPATGGRLARRLGPVGRLGDGRGGRRRFDLGRRRSTLVGVAIGSPTGGGPAAGGGSDLVRTGRRGTDRNRSAALTGDRRESEAFRSGRSERGRRRTGVLRERRPAWSAPSRSRAAWPWPLRGRPMAGPVARRASACHPPRAWVEARRPESGGGAWPPGPWRAVPISSPGCRASCPSLAWDRPSSRPASPPHFSPVRAESCRRQACSSPSWAAASLRASPC